jgi:hypothetical protein
VSNPVRVVAGARLGDPFGAQLGTELVQTLNPVGAVVAPGKELGTSMPGDPLVAELGPALAPNQYSREERPS